MHNTHTIWPPLLLRTGKCLGPRGGAFKSVEEKNKKTLGTKTKKTACTILLGCFSECCVLSWRRRRIWRHFQFGKVPFLLVRLCREEPFNLPFKTLLLMSSTWRHRHPHLSIKIWNPLLVFCFLLFFGALSRRENLFFFFFFGNRQVSPSCYGRLRNLLVCNILNPLIALLVFYFFI